MRFSPLLPLLFGLRLSAAKIDHLNGEILEPRHPEIRFYNIKESGGFINLSDLTFTTTGDATADVVVLRVNPSCLESVEACGWVGLGVGEKSENKTVFCREVGNTFQGGGLIMSSYLLEGKHWSVALDESMTWDDQPGKIRDGTMYAWEGGDYAVFMINCGSSNVDVTGDLHWVSYPKDSPFASSLSLELDFQVITEDCGLEDLFPEEQVAGDDDMAFIKTVEEYFEEIGVQCSEEQSTEMYNAFVDFETCAGFDLKEFIEDFPSAVLGTAIECIVTTNWTSVSDWMDPEDLLSIQLSERCLDFEFGDNAVGNGIRKIVLNPGRVLPCFTELSDNVPSCSLETWPIPIVGGWLKPAACVAGGLMKILNDVLKIEMKIWDTCLPRGGGCENDCAHEGSLFVRGGGYSMPISDVMKQIAEKNNGKLQDALDRYEKYLSECTIEWDGWTKYNNTNGSSIGHRKKSTEQNTEAKNSQESDSSGISRQGSSWLSFFGGLVIGAICVVLVLVVKAKGHTQNDDTKPTPQPEVADSPAVAGNPVV